MVSFLLPKLHLETAESSAPESLSNYSDEVSYLQHLYQPLGTSSLPSLLKVSPFLSAAAPLLTELGLQTFYSCTVSNDGVRWGRDKITVLYLKTQEMPHAGDLSICLVKEVKHRGEGRRIVNSRLVWV